jgi:hypothetical protein
MEMPKRYSGHTVATYAQCRDVQTKSTHEAYVTVTTNANFEAATCLTLSLCHEDATIHFVRSIRVAVR